MKHISRFLDKGNTIDFFSGPTSNLLVDSDTFIGLEIEVENLDCSLGHLNSYPLFIITRDSSLRPRDLGREFVFLKKNPWSGISEPLRGLDYENGVRSFCKYLSDKEYTFSNRTGLHLHINVLDFQDEELMFFVYIFIIFEYIFFRYCGMERLENTYCKPFTNSDQYLSLPTLEEALKGKTFSKYFSYDYSKRMDLNLRSVEQKGTVEIRLHPATDNFEDIIRWTNIMLKVKEFAKSKPDLMELCKLASADGPMKLLTRVFGEDLATYLFTQNSRRDLFKGIRNFQQIAA